MDVLFEWDLGISLKFLQARDYYGDGRFSARELPLRMASLVQHENDRKVE
jgi:hypothetical protein